MDILGLGLLAHQNHRIAFVAEHLGAIGIEYRLTGGGPG